MKLPYYFSFFKHLFFLLFSIVSAPHIGTAQEIPDKSLIGQPVKIDSFHLNWFEREGWHHYYAERFDSMAMLGKHIWEAGKKASSKDPNDSLAVAFKLLGKGEYGQGRCMMGYFEEGLPLGEEALREAEAYFGPIMRLSYGYVGLGIVASEFGDYEKDLWAQQQASRIVALHIKKGSPSYHLVGNKETNVAMAYRKLGKMEESLSMFKKAISSYEISESHIGIPMTHIRIARLYSDFRLFNKAGIHLEKSIEIINSLDNQSQLMILQFYIQIEKGNINFALEDYHEAFDDYDEALRIAIGLTKLPKDNTIYATNYTNDVSQAYHHLAKTALRLNKLGQAEQLIKKAKDYWLVASNEQMEEWNTLLLTEVEIQLKKGNYKNAFSSLAAIASNYAPQSYFEADDSWPVTSFPLNGSLLEAFELRAKAFDLASGKDGSYTRKDVIQACEAGQQYLERLVDALTFAGDQSRLIQEHKYLYDKPVSLYYQQYASKGDEKALDRLFIQSEKVRSLNLMAKLQQRNLQVRMGLPQEMKEQEEHAKKQKERYKQLLAEAALDPETDKTLVLEYQQWLKKYDKQLNDIAAEIESQYPAYYQLRYERPALSRSQVQSKLQPGELLISYYQTTDQVIAMALNSSGLTAWSIPADEAFSNTFNRFTSSIRNRPDEQAMTNVSAYAEQSLFLFQQLLAPALNELPGTEQLILLPDGKLNYLPWAALTTKQAASNMSFRNLPYLMREYAVRQEYAAAVLFNSPPHAKSEFPYLGYAPRYEGEGRIATRGADSLQFQRLYPTLYRNGLPQLKKSVPEVQQSQAFFPDGIPFLREEATESAFKQHSQSGSIQHFSMHAFTNDQDPMRSLLAFSSATQDTSEDGLLYAYEIYNMDIPAEIAVLSACSTGDGVFLEGQGVMSLAHAFKYAGCRDVLMTQWLADDEASYQLVTRFFQQLKSGTDKAKALKNATLAYLNEGGPNPYAAHPHYWAGFALIGPGEPLQTSGAWWYWLIGLPALLFIVFAIYRKRNQD